MTVYRYKRTAGKGYHWNRLARIYYELGVWPISSIHSGEDLVELTFESSLSDTQIQKLNALMAADSTLPPDIDGTVFEIEGLWEHFELFRKRVGLNCQLYFTKSAEDSSEYDTIRLQFLKKLSSNEKKKVVSEYAKLIKEVKK